MPSQDASHPTTETLEYTFSANGIVLDPAATPTS